MTKSQETTPPSVGDELMTDEQVSEGIALSTGAALTTAQRLQQRRDAEKARLAQGGAQR